jgi:hypothetical protein
LYREDILLVWAESETDGAAVVARRGEQESGTSESESGTVTLTLKHVVDVNRVLDDNADRARRQRQDVATAGSDVQCVGKCCNLGESDVTLPVLDAVPGGCAHSGQADFSVVGWGSWRPTPWLNRPG